MFIRESLERYLNQLSSESPAPGGGSASALVASLGVSLLLMVSKITRKKQSGGERKSLDRTIKGLNIILKDTKQIVDLDVRIYKNLIKAYQNAKKSSASPAKSRKTIETALTNSFRLQADLALLIILAKATLPQIERLVKGSIKNDLTVAKGFLDGAFRGAISTARINLVYMKSGKVHFEQALSKLEKRYK